MPGNNSKQSGENNNPFMQAVACIRLDALVLIRTSSDDEIHLSLVVSSNSYVVVRSTRPKKLLE